MSKLFKTAAGGRDWFNKVRLGDGRRKAARLVSDRQASGAIHVALQAAVDRQGIGLPPTPEQLAAIPRRLAESFKLVPELALRRRATWTAAVADYTSELRTAGRDATYIRIARMYLAELGETCGFGTLAAVDRDRLVSHLEKRRADGAAPRTLKNIASAARAFCAWAVQTGRLDRNPLAHAVKIDTSERKRQRRAFTPDEAARLLAAAGKHELCYRLALGSGLRLGELRRLEWRDVQTSGPRPCIELRPEATKSKRADVLPLPLALADRLDAVRPADAAPTARVFPTVPGFDIWQADLERAGLPYVGADGKRLGFHSLRTTYISELHRAGVDPRTIMQLARHTDYRLTASVYTDVRVLDTFSAASKLPTYEAPKPTSEPAALPRTGTGGDAVGAVTSRIVKRDHRRDQNPCFSVPFGSAPVPSDARGGARSEAQNTGKAVNGREPRRTGKNSPRATLFISSRAPRAPIVLTQAAWPGANAKTTCARAS